MSDNSICSAFCVLHIYLANTHITNNISSFWWILKSVYLEFINTNASVANGEQIFLVVLFKIGRVNSVCLLLFKDAVCRNCCHLSQWGEKWRIIF